MDGHTVQGVDLLFVVSQWPAKRAMHLDTLARARAIENQTFLALCNSAAADTACAGHSAIIDPWGDIIAEGGGEEEIITGSIDYTKTREVRDLIHMFRDRQPTLYGDTLLRPVD